MELTVAQKIFEYWKKNVMLVRLQPTYRDELTKINELKKLTSMTLLAMMVSCKELHRGLRSVPSEEGRKDATLGNAFAVLLTCGTHSLSTYRCHSVHRSDRNIKSGDEDSSFFKDSMCKITATEYCRHSRNSNYARCLESGVHCSSAS